jgi:hypothetical protein
VSVALAGIIIVAVEAIAILGLVVYVARQSPETDVWKIRRADRKAWDGLSNVSGRIRTWKYIDGRGLILVGEEIEELHG